MLERSWFLPFCATPTLTLRSIVRISIRCDDGDSPSSIFLADPTNKHKHNPICLDYTTPLTVKLKTIRPWRVLVGASKARRLPKSYKAIPPSVRQFQTSRIANMATIQLDDNAKGLITRAYPQAKEEDPVKLSSAVFPQAEVSFNSERKAFSEQLTNIHADAVLHR